LNSKAQEPEVLGRESDGNPCFGSFKLGKGKVHLLTMPIEQVLVATPGAFHGENATPLWKLYANIAKRAVAGRAVVRKDKTLGVTEHDEDAKSRIAFFVNYSPEDSVYEFSLNGKWKIAKTLWGEAPKAAGKAFKVEMKGNASCVLRLVKA
jgi:hypothetical protein